MVRPRTFFDFQVDNQPIGRVIFELYNDTAPKTVENFRVLCTGERGISPTSQHPLYYKNSTIHRSIQDFMIQGGDFTKFNGTGGESIYGGSFADEDLERPLDTEALLCMANKGPNTNNSQFFVTLRECPHLNGKHVVFGRVISGFDIVQKIAAFSVDGKSRPLSPVVISNCGELELCKPPTKPAAEEESKKKRSSRRSRSESRSRSRSPSDSRSPSPERERRRRKKKKSKRKHTPSPSPPPDSKVPGEPREETEEEYDARLEREEKERLEEARKKELLRIKEKYEQEMEEMSKRTGGVRFKDHGLLRQVPFSTSVTDKLHGTKFSNFKESQMRDDGSWADEMDSLPNAPAARSEDDQGGRPGYGRRDDFLSSRPDRGGPPREDIPLPTQPPYTAFIGNLAFDLTESELEDFFDPTKTKSVKIIKDREDKPKGFGYIEFEDLDGLKDAIAKSGSNFSGRTIRVSVAEPPKERSAFGGSGGGGFEDDAKFDNPWRRDGPLPDAPRDSSRRRFDGPPPERERLPSVAEGVSDWRSSRPRPVVSEEPPPRRRSGFSTPEGQPSPADQAEVWTKGSKFVPTAPSEERYGGIRGGRGDMGPPKESPADEGDWRSARSKSSISRKLYHLSNVHPIKIPSAASSTPPTPARRKLELLPRSGTPSAAQSPLSSPKMAPTPAAAPSSARASPFGAARPVDVASKEKEVTERLEKEKELLKERLPMSRTNSRQASERTPLTSTHTIPTSAAGSAVGSASPKIAPKSLAPSVRPTLSFANAAAAKKEAAVKEDKSDEVEKVAEKVAEVEV
ncbi:hypothetical protein H0H87_011886 [Tephrocybe sp. NHM501043]|nr:hypothetical protein H0H87_011886 [Tephrocybe sp. NHM501043]